MLPPDPHPIVEELKLLSSTSCSRRLNVRRRSSSLQFPDARLPKGRRHRELCSSFLASLAGSRRAEQQAAPIVAASSSVLGARPVGAAPRASSSLLSLGEALPPPDPHPIVGTLKGSSSTGCPRRFTFLEGTHRQFSRLALAGRPGELPLPPSSSLAALEGSSEAAVLVRHRGVLSSRPKGRPRELALPLSQAASSKARHLWNSPLPASRC